MPKTEERQLKSESVNAEHTRHVSGIKLRASTATASSDGRFRLLVVDDEPEIRRMLVRALSKDYLVHATDAVGALTALGDGEHFDAMLSDVSMPVISGVMLFQAVEELCATLADRTIMMSAGPGALATDFIAQRKIPLLTKPFPLEALRALLSTLCVPRDVREAKG